eukprot:GEMP01054422.1.p1 GENE.GEMP01054422.1~~GEMP01054422.1.p1  ORF type:complete len:410 (+),score=109.13 GEMP01054422.1:23-1252(+)
MYAEVIDFLRVHPRCILQGPHGSGKTFLLRELGATIVDFDDDASSESLPPDNSLRVALENLENVRRASYPNTDAVCLDRILSAVPGWVNVIVTCVHARRLPLMVQSWPVISLPIPLTRARRLKMTEAMLRQWCAQSEKVEGDQTMEELRRGAGLASFVADVTAGYLPCDVEALLRSARLTAVRHGANLSKEIIADAAASIIPTSARAAGGAFLLKEPIAALSRNQLVGLKNALEQAERYLCDQHRVALIGGPGTGKTTLTLEIAWRSTHNVFVVHLEDLLRPLLGESEKALQRVLDAVRLCAPSLLILENFDQMGATSLGTTTRLLLMLAQALELPDVRVIATGRTLVQSFPCVHLLGLSPDDAQALWERHLGPGATLPDHLPTHNASAIVGAAAQLKMEMVEKLIVQT